MLRVLTNVNARLHNLYKHRKLPRFPYLSLCPLVMLLIKETDFSLIANPTNIRPVRLLMIRSEMNLSTQLSTQLYTFLYAAFLYLNKLKTIIAPKTDDSIRSTFL